MIVIATARFDSSLLTTWAKDGSWPKEHEQCAPDFSCCRPGEKRSDAERAAFLAASMESRCRFLTHWFASALRNMLTEDGIQREILILDGDNA